VKSDTAIKADVDAELLWSPEIDETDIATKVTTGVVTLTGFVHSYFEKGRAETIVKKVIGVTGVANDIEVRLGIGSIPTDPEIAREAVDTLRRECPWALETIRPAVHKGFVTLEGAVDWQYQREQAGSAVAKIKGVASVINALRIKPSVLPGDIKQRIEDAFRRSAAVDASRISVEANGCEVILRGEVSSWSERDEAQATAWSAPGVTHVRNQLSIKI